MTHYTVALNFEDGITRFVECRAGEKVLDAAFRARINLPMDCSDGVCGTCKCRAESGRYDLGDDYIEDALSDAEKDDGLVLTCQMIPESDCVIAVPASSSVCKTEQACYSAAVASIAHHSDAAVSVALTVDGAPPIFLAGQYLNFSVPGSDERRSYSFSSAPGDAEVRFLIKKIPGGLMSTWLDKAEPGSKVTLTGPLGSFYLRPIERPLLFIAGGTGLAPFLSMLEVIARTQPDATVHLLYGVSRDADLVALSALDAYRTRLSHFTYTTVVSDPESQHPQKGWVTHHLPPETLKDGGVDVYLCGPPPMVDAVRRHFDENGVQANSFHYEKFTPNAVMVTA